ncbi:DUF1697 domain-containing protein [Sphingobacterium suaedae]|uniref:DUF1697 domain-containing protein n=1 Tax=Sphingobacterium suaedae TaxID=1686402 RepID=A0ABW5KFL5_9SPHI
MNKQNNFIILLRAVNVSGKNSIKMEELRSALTKEGFSDVRTYIQSGNILLHATAGAEEVKERVHKVLIDRFELHVDVFVLNSKQVEQAIAGIPRKKDLAPNRLFIMILDQSPQTGYIAALQQVDHGQEWFHIQDRMVYFYLPEGAAKAKMSNNYFERKLKVVGTGRNLNTYRKLLALSTNS